MSKVEPTLGGQHAPSLDLPDLDGVPVRIAAFLGRPVLVSFLRHAG